MVPFRGAAERHLIKSWPFEIKQKERDLVLRALGERVGSHRYLMPDLAVWYEGIEGFKHRFVLIPDSSGYFISRVVYISPDGVSLDMTKGVFCLNKGKRKMLGKDQLTSFMHTHLMQVPPQNAFLQRLGVSEEERQKIVRYVQENVSQWATFRKNHRIHREASGLSQSLLVMADKTNGLTRVLMRVDKGYAGIVGEGEQREVEFAVDLTSCDLLATKRLRLAEMAMIRQLRGKKGICGVVCLRKSGRLFAPLYDGTLEELIRSGLLNVKKKMKIVKQLLQGLVAIHSLKTSEGAPAFHSDIKPANILYRINQYRILAVIDDFGLCNRTSSLAGSPLWTSPEYAQVIDMKEGGAVLNTFLNRTCGQGLDVWGMGLVFYYLLSGSEMPSWMPSDRVTERVFYREMAELSPSIVNEHLGRKALQSLTSEEFQMWQITRQMLQVDYRLRLTAASALSLFNEKLGVYLARL